MLTLDIFVDTVPISVASFATVVTSLEIPATVVTLLAIPATVVTLEDIPPTDDILELLAKDVKTTHHYTTCIFTKTQCGDLDLD